jgi:eukaryotic-like serine/threonine-protein kinase
MTAGIPFGEYLLIRRLGKGGMAEVFLAKRVRAKGFEKLLVVKRLLPHLCRDERAAAMFLNEARVAALIDHPNLAHVSDFGEVQGSYYLAMEYVQGSSLADVLQAVGSIPIPIAVRVVIELLEALHAIHSASGADGVSLGLVHRDVSPRNVMIRPDGVVKLLDLGIVASKDDGEHRTAGTRGYMSPEQARGEKVDARSDLYSVGVLLARMITGLSHSTPVTSERLADLPPQLERLLSRALSPDPDERPSSALELHGLLEAFVAPFGVESSRMRVGALAPRGPRPRSIARRLATQIVRLTRMTRVDPLAEDEVLAPPSPRRRVGLALSFVFAGAVAAGLAFAILSTRSEPRNAAAVAKPPEPSAKEASVPEENAEAAEVALPQAAVVDGALAEVAESGGPDETLHPGKRTGARRREGQPGFLTIDTEPWTEVYLGGKKLGITPLEAVRVPRGAHEIELRNEQFGLRRRLKVVIHAGAVTRVHRTF